MSSLETANIGRAVAARVGTNIREVRTRLGMTQAQLAAPEFSISYISAIERGKIRPSLKALSILARRLDVPLTFLLEGLPAGAAEARAVGYSPADSEPDQRVDVDLLQAAVFVQQHEDEQAALLLAPLQPERITTDQVYRLSLLHGHIHIGEGQYQEAITDVRAAVSQAQAMDDAELLAHARLLLGKVHFALSQFTLAFEQHRSCLNALEGENPIPDPLFTLDVLQSLANDAFRLGDLEQAVIYSSRALEMYEDLSQDSKSYAQQYMEVSQRYKAANKLMMARDYAMRSLAIYEMRDQQRLVGLTHQRLGRMLEKQNKLDEAEQEYQQAISIERELNDEAAASQCSTSLAELLLKRGDAQGAENEAQEALDSAEKSHDAQTEGQAWIVLAQIRHQTGDDTGADEAFERALDLIEQSGVHDAAASAFFRYANQLETRGEVQRSLDAIKKAYEHQRRTPGSPTSEAEAARSRSA